MRCSRYVSQEKPDYNRCQYESCSIDNWFQSFFDNWKQGSTYIFIFSKDFACFGLTHG